MVCIYSKGTDTLKISDNVKDGRFWIGDMRYICTLAQTQPLHKHHISAALLLLLRFVGVSFKALSTHTVNR